MFVSPEFILGRMGVPGFLRYGWVDFLTSKKLKEGIMDFIPRQEISFLLNDWLQVGALVDRPYFSQHNEDVFEQVLDLAATIARDAFAPHYQRSDAVEPKLVDGKVELIPEIQAALETYAEAGFCAAAFPETVGGMRATRLKDRSPA